MPTFAYRARNSAGQEVTGTLVADTSLAAVRALSERMLLPVEVQEQQAAGRSLLTGRARRIGLAKVGLFYEQLADLLKAGVPVLRALGVLARQSSSPSLSRVLREVHDDIAGGDTFADALEKHPSAFPPLHVAMFRAGEKGGFLEDVLSRVAHFVARQDALRNKFVGSLIYPCILLMVGLGAIAFIMAYVVPRIRSLLEVQPNLPALTRIIFGISDLLAAHWLTVLLLLAAVIAATWAFLRTPTGRRVRAHLQLRTPGLGRIYTMVALCRFCRIFGTLLANGIPIIQALRIAKDSTGNEILAASIEKAADNVSAGESLAGPLHASRIFPPAMVDMIAVAEESNTLEKVLIQIAETQEERTARQIDLFVRLLEPLMLMVMGLMVFSIAVALLLPILRMSSQGLR
jgi:general secretion pathway protein F